MKYMSHAVQFSLLKSAGQCVLVYSPNSTSIANISFQNVFIPRRKLSTGMAAPHVPACKLFPRLQTAPAELAQSRGLAALRWLCWRAFEGVSLQESLSRRLSAVSGAEDGG